MQLHKQTYTGERDSCMYGLLGYEEQGEVVLNMNHKFWEGKEAVKLELGVRAKGPRLANPIVISQGGNSKVLIPQNSKARVEAVYEAISITDPKLPISITGFKEPITIKLKKSPRFVTVVLKSFYSKFSVEVVTSEGKLIHDDSHAAEFVTAIEHNKLDFVLHKLFKFMVVEYENLELPAKKGVQMQEVVILTQQYSAFLNSLITKLDYRAGTSLVELKPWIVKLHSLKQAGRVTVNSYNQVAQDLIFIIKQSIPLAVDLLDNHYNFKYDSSDVSAVV